MIPSEFLSQLDSHSIYPVSVLDDLDPEYRHMVATFTHQQTAQRMADRGLGGTLADDTGTKVIYGWTSASGLAMGILGKCSQALGRGTAFRQNVALLKEAGK
jgi:hypothetical protein